MIIGCDIAEYQPNWTPASDEDFVIIKATLGQTIVDPKASRHAEVARDAGLVVGFYHFLWPSHDSGTGAEQADWFLSHIPSLKPGELLICDWESNNAGLPSEADVKSFIDRLADKKPDHRRGLYATPSRHRELQIPDCFVWVAHWDVSKPSVDEWTLWQYTDSPYDHDKGDFDSRDAMKKWAAGESGDSGTGDGPLGLNKVSKWSRSIDQTIPGPVPVT